MRHIYAFIFGVLAYGGFYAHADDEHFPCPAGHIRSIADVIVMPAVITDVYGEVEVFTSTGLWERTIPAIIKWIDMPENYVRPKTITVTTTYKTAPTYKAELERYIFRKASHDLMTNIRGEVLRRHVHAIYMHRVKYKLDRSSATEKITTKDMPYDRAHMEKDGKLLIVIQGASYEYLNSDRILKQRKIISQTRKPAIIKEVYGACIVTQDE